MGLIVDGQWVDEWYDAEKSGGRFERQNSAFRHWIGSDHGRFAAESGRYHLYVSPACPWAHRTLIFRSIKRLEAHISVSVVDPLSCQRVGFSLSQNLLWDACACMRSTLRRMRFTRVE